MYKIHELSFEIRQKRSMCSLIKMINYKENINTGKKAYIQYFESMFISRLRIRFCHLIQIGFDANYIIACLLIRGIYTKYYKQSLYIISYTLYIEIIIKKDIQLRIRKTEINVKSFQN